MKNYIRFFTAGFVPCALIALATMAMCVRVNADVLTLDFAGGNGTTSVDQYTGIAGSGWKTAWTNAAGTSISSYSGTVTNATPLYVGGDNYLSLNFSVTGTNTTNQWIRTSRQVDSTAINLSSAVTYKFTLRPDSTVSGSNEYFTIFSATAATNFTGGTDTWKISADGGGWNVYDGTTAIGMGKIGALNLSGTDYQFTIFSDPTTQNWTVTINNLTNGTSTTSGTLAWRSKGTSTTEDSFINIVSGSGSTSAAMFGYSLDNLSVIPEPVTAALVMAGGLVLLCVQRTRRHTS